MTQPTKYIYLLFEDSNFCAKSMLIPYVEFMKQPQRVDDLRTLKAHCAHYVPFTRRGKDYIVDNLLVQSYTYSGTTGIRDQLPFTKVLDEFFEYLEWGNENGCKAGDEAWVEKIRTNCVKDMFEPVVAYCDFRHRNSYKGKPIIIVDGFLVLESRITDNGQQIQNRDVYTVDEMYDKYYPVSNFNDSGSHEGESSEDSN